MRTAVEMRMFMVSVVIPFVFERNPSPMM